MKFFLQDDIADKVDEIIKRINKLMDGDVSHQMEEHGLKYSLNYGASILWLREMAKEYDADNKLANRLWHREIRETMILATLIADASSLSEKDIEAWALLLQHNEIAEQLGFNLLWKLNGLEDLATEWLTSDHKLKQAAMWVGLAVYLQKGGSIDQTKLNVYFNLIKKSFNSTEKFMLRVQGRFLRQLCRKSDEFLSMVDHFMSEIAGCANSAWLYEDVMTEINFLKQ